MPRAHQQDQVPRPQEHGGPSMIVALPVLWFTSTVMGSRMPSFCTEDLRLSTCCLVRLPVPPEERRFRMLVLSPETMAASRKAAVGILTFDALDVNVSRAPDDRRNCNTPPVAFAPTVARGTARSRAADAGSEVTRPPRKGISANGDLRGRGKIGIPK